MRNLKLICLTGCVILSGPIVSAMAGDKSETSDRDRTFAKLSQLVGGT